MNGLRTRLQLENRNLFLRPSLRVRIARWYRRTFFGWIA